MKEYCFKVCFGEGRYAKGTYDVVAENEETATAMALSEICAKLYNALPDLDVEVTVELVEERDVEVRNKYCVTVTRTGCVFVEANSEEEAIDIANHQTTDTVSWSDDWEATDCIADDSALSHMYVTEKAFE